MPLGKLRVLCIRYFSKTERKPAKKITGQCCSTEMEFACLNSANLEQETKTTKIVTYPLLSLASSLRVGLRSWFEFSALCFDVTLYLSGYLAPTPFSMSNLRQ